MLSHHYCFLLFSEPARAAHYNAPKAACAWPCLPHWPSHTPPLQKEAALSLLIFAIIVFRWDWPGLYLLYHANERFFCTNTPRRDGHGRHFSNKMDCKIKSEKWLPWHTKATVCLCVSGFCFEVSAPAGPNIIIILAI